MSYKFDSMMRILNMLDRNERITRKQLAEILSVNIRSADRYIATLRNADFPVIFDEDRNSYVFEKGFSLAKADLKAEEKLALGLAKGLASKFGPNTARVLESVEHKMTTCSFSLPPHVKFAGHDMPAEVEDRFKRLNYAIANLNLIEMDYHSAYSGGQKTHRIAEPYILFHQEGVWYLRAYCRTHKGLRVFALDRMEGLQALDDKHFTPRPEVSGAELTDAFADGDPVDAVLRFDSACRPYLERYKYRKLKELPDGRIEVRVRTIGTKSMKLWLYRFLPNVEVVSPKSLKEEIRQELKEAAAKI